jgi:fructose-1,6-bisphosphatase III
MASGDDDTLRFLRALSKTFPTADAAISELASLRATLTLPKGTSHVISDIHGEYQKLRHVINNASGSLRPLVTSLFGERLTDAERRELLAVLYYPLEAFDFLSDRLAERAARLAWVNRTLRLQFEIVRALARTRRRTEVVALVPPEHFELFSELLGEDPSGRDARYIATMIEALDEHGRDLAAVRAASRLVRNLSNSEILVAGDLGDRGERIDRVIDYLQHQPNVPIVWGNHDASWLGACLGSDACITTVVRFSLRYRRLSQLEEGYGVIMSPLEKLARDAYGDDPCERFHVKGEGLRDELHMARMQKAMAILQFKAEGRLIHAHPEWNLGHRGLLERVDPKTWTVEIDGSRYPLTDTHFPTIDWSDPYAYSAEEARCMDRLRRSFLGSQRLWQHMSWVVARGSMWTRRDDVLIFHGCVPVDAAGEPLGLAVDGRMLAGRELFDACYGLVRRAYRGGAGRQSADADWFWYLWCGPRSPLFGKDRVTAFEVYFVDNKATHVETKNPYFELIHDAGFVKKIGRLFGMGDDVLVVNGHVPVKIDKGELPVKRGGNAVTIDGAFSKAYGDHGYTLILAPDAIRLAEHHHFDSIDEVLQSGKDIVPKVTTIRSYPAARAVADTEEGERVRRTIADLEALVSAYEDGALDEVR